VEALEAGLEQALSLLEERHRDAEQATLELLELSGQIRTLVELQRSYRREMLSELGRLLALQAIRGWEEPAAS
jgi:hypothetical protein